MALIISHLFTFTQNKKQEKKQNVLPLNRHSSFAHDDKRQVKKEEQEDFRILFGWKVKLISLHIYRNHIH